MKVSFSASFTEAYKALAHDKRRAASRAIEKLMTEPPAQSLKLRRLQGSEDLWIASVNKGDRIIYRLIESDVMELLDIGTHDATYAKWNRRK